MDGTKIHGDRVAALINECRDACYLLTEKEQSNDQTAKNSLHRPVSEQEMINIRWMLTRMDGKQIVQNMKPEELVEWVLDLRECGPKMNTEELMAMAKVVMKRE